MMRAEWEGQEVEAGFCLQTRSTVVSGGESKDWPRDFQRRFVCSRLRPYDPEGSVKRAVCVALLCLGFWVPVVAKTITADLNGGGDFTEIQVAIDAVEDGAGAA